MTLDRQLRTRLNRARAVALGSWLLFAAGLLLFPDGMPCPALLSIPFLGFICAVLYILFFLKCPKCGTRLGHALSGFKRPRFCPGCGIAFDSES